MEDAWKSTEFVVLPHRDSKDIFILGGTDDIQVLLDDSQVGYLEQPFSSINNRDHIHSSNTCIMTLALGIDCSLSKDNIHTCTCTLYIQ